LREDLEPTLNRAQTDQLESLIHAVRQGAELVDRLLDFTAVGRRTEPNQTVNIGAFLRQVVSSLDLPPHVEVVIGDDWPSIDSNPTLLQQIFENLIRNAIRFNQSQKKRVEIGWMPARDEQYEIFVRDNGIGIEPRHHERIFGVFERLHGRDEYKGLGVGLSIVKKAVSKMHGSVRLRSKPGEGSTFSVFLPKKAQW
jgi:signal transduction histidine kinase